MQTTAAPATVTPLDTLRGTTTPSRMRVAAGVTAVLAIVAALVGSNAIAARRTTISEAAASAAQLQRIEGIRSSIVEADSLAAAGYLASGLEQPSQQALYDRQLSAAQTGVVDAAAQAAEADVEALSRVGDSLTTYSGLVEQARANNRQGFPVGAAYQRQASALVRDEVLPQIDQLTVDTATRTSDSVSDGVTPQVALWLSAIAAIAAIALGSFWLLGRTNRVLNAGLVVGGVLLVLATVFASVSLASATSTSRDVLDGPYATATELAAARTAGFDAKSNESLTLIARGNGTAFEQRWSQQADVASAALERAADLDSTAAVEAIDHFEAYREFHADIRALDDAGEYDEAVQLALSQSTEATPADATGETAFAGFAESARLGLDEASAATSTQLDDAASSLGTPRWIVLIGGLMAAGAVAIGYGRRIREYR